MVCQHLRCLALPYLASPSISLPYLAFRCLPLPCPDPLPAPPFPCVAFTKPPLLCLPFRCLAFASADLPCLTLPCLAFLTLPLPYLPHPCLVLCCCSLVLPICPLPFLTDQLFPFLALPTPPLPLFLFGHMTRGEGGAGGLLASLPLLAALSLVFLRRGERSSPPAPWILRFGAGALPSSPHQRPVPRVPLPRGVALGRTGVPSGSQQL